MLMGVALLLAGTTGKFRAVVDSPKRKQALPANAKAGTNTPIVVS